VFRAVFVAGGNDLFYLSNKGLTKPVGGHVLLALYSQRR